MFPYKKCVTEKRTYVKTVKLGSMPSLLIVSCQYNKSYILDNLQLCFSKKGKTTLTKPFTFWKWKLIPKPILKMKTFINLFQFNQIKSFILMNCSWPMTLMPIASVWKLRIELKGKAFWFLWQYTSSLTDSKDDVAQWGVGSGKEPWNYWQIGEIDLITSKN